MVFRDNEERVRTLEHLKIPYLFTSRNMEKLLDITTSVKTKLNMIRLIGPRLVDPSSESSVLKDMFHFSEDKHVVEEVLRDRINTLASTKFTKSNISNSHLVHNSLTGRGIGGRVGGIVAARVKETKKSSEKIETNSPSTSSQLSNENDVDINLASIDIQARPISSYGSYNNIIKLNLDEIKDGTNNLNESPTKEIINNNSNSNLADSSSNEKLNNLNNSGSSFITSRYLTAATVNKSSNDSSDTKASNNSKKKTFDKNDKSVILSGSLGGRGRNNKPPFS